MMLGILDPIYEGLGYVIRFCYSTIGFESYALALFWFALMVKIIMLPLSIKRQKTSIKSAKLRPRIWAIEQKYAGRSDPATTRKKQQEILELQQKEGVSPLSGCLPMLIQLPFILVLYQIVQRPLSFLMMMDGADITFLTESINEMIALANPTLAADELKKLMLASSNEIAVLNHIFSYGIEAFPMLAGRDIPNFTLFGIIDLSQKPGAAIFSWMIFIPILVFLSQFFTMKLTRKMNPMMQAQDQTPEQAMSMKIMDLMMPAMMVFMAFTLPGALGIYWVFQSLLMMLETFLLNKFMPLPTFTKEEMKAALKAMKAKPKKPELDPSRPRPRSMHHIDDEDYVAPPTPSTQKKSKVIEGAPMKKDDRPRPEDPGSSDGNS